MEGCGATATFAPRPWPPHQNHRHNALQPLQEITSLKQHRTTSTAFFSTLHSLPTLSGLHSLGSPVTKLLERRCRASAKDILSVQKHGNRTRSLRFLSFTPPHCLHTTTMATHTQPRAAHNHSQEITHQHRTTSTTITTTSSAHYTPLSLLSLVFFSLLFSHLFSIIGGLIDKSKAYEARHHAAETWMSGSVRARTIRSGRFRGWCPDGPSLQKT